MVKKLDWIQYLEKNQPLFVATHDDADGIYSAVLFSYVFEVKDIYIPEIFGDYGDESHVSLDLGAPLNKFTGVAIDHHSHQVDSKMTYQLVYNQCPTGLIVYNWFKEQIPDEMKWKVAGACVGDGQPEKIPTEIFTTFGKELLERRGRIYPKYRVNPNIYKYIPVYKLLSAPVNACCRAGYPTEAYRVVRSARTPTDILTHPTFNEMANKIRSDEERIWKEDGIVGAISFNDYISIFSFSSDFKMSGRIASKLKMLDQDKTWIVINNKRGEISVRGDLALYIASHLEGSSFKMGGHAGYCGSAIPEGKTAEDFIDTLRKVL